MVQSTPVQGFFRLLRVGLLRLIEWLPLALLCVSLLSGSNSPPPLETRQRVRAFTRPLEFEYASWTLGALQTKFLEASLGASKFLSTAERQAVVLEYLDLTAQIQQKNAALRRLYADPNLRNPQAASRLLRLRLEALRQQQERLAPLAEAIIQEQVSSVVGEMGLAVAGQVLPPVLYRSTALPLALIVSPRHVIRQEADISLTPGLTLEQQMALEERVDRALNVSSLVVEIGGVGIYPTMVMQTSDLPWLVEVVAHEWVHNYLTLRPLGLNYYTSPQLRTMNETAATIAGKEIGHAVLARYYPQFLPPPAPPTPSSPPEEGQPLPFNFRKEMHLTRVIVDQLLAEGKVEEAEAYMEARRRFFWENGYRNLRKLNQAYFAFYGAYADEPLGAAGEDPVGAAVRALRARSPSLAAFLRSIAWMTSYEQLLRALGQTP